MSDLQTRIVDAIKRVDAQPSGETDPYEDMADAVIAALGLRYQLAPEGGPWTGHHRYLTDWKWEPINE
jgi:hypothetical protein